MALQWQQHLPSELRHQPRRCDRTLTTRVRRSVQRDTITWDLCAGRADTAADIDTIAVVGRASHLDGIIAAQPCAPKATTFTPIRGCADHNDIGMAARDAVRTH